MSNRVFVIADLHFGHEKVAQYRGFENASAHDQALVNAWNRVIHKRDTVYVLGDVFRVDRVPELNGVKKLCLGNHDERPIGIYEGLFSKVNAYFQYNGCILSHIPVHESQFSRWLLNIHGHTHARGLDDPRYVAVSVEQCRDLEPKLLNELIHNRLALITGGHA